MKWFEQLLVVPMIQANQTLWRLFSVKYTRQAVLCASIMMISVIGSAQQQLFSANLSENPLFVHVSNEWSVVFPRGLTTDPEFCKAKTTCYQVCDFEEGCCTKCVTIPPPAICPKISFGQFTDSPQLSLSGYLDSLDECEGVFCDWIMPYKIRRSYFDLMFENK